MSLSTINGHNVSKICLGTMTWGQQNTEAEAHAQIDFALEQGINFMDAAEMYPVPPQAATQGRTEAFIGSWFKKPANDPTGCLPQRLPGQERNLLTYARVPALIARSSLRLSTAVCADVKLIISIYTNYTGLSGPPIVLVSAVIYTLMTTHQPP